MELFINNFGKPIIPKCGNCHFWSKLNPTDKKENSGYCKLIRLQFAYTRKNNVYPLTKDFYFCDNHKLYNEEELETLTVKREYENIEQAVAEFQKK